MRAALVSIAIVALGAAPGGCTDDSAAARADDAAQAAAPAQVAAPTPPAVVDPAQLGPVHRLSVTDLDGKPISLASLAGRPMIIEIWATWCGPCRKNRETVHSLRSRMPANLAVVGISMDTGPELVRGFLRTNQPNDFEFMATPEFNEFVRSINPSPSIPKTMYVDSRGRVADLSEGTQSGQWLMAMAKNLK